MIDIYKAIADPTRRAIMDELVERDRQTLFEICARLATKHGLTPTRQAVSQHLAVLEEAGLLVTRRDGRYKFHSIDLTPLREIATRWPTTPRAKNRKAATPCASTSAASSSTTRTRHSPSTRTSSVS